jgi:uncharacterized protein YpmB
MNKIKPALTALLAVILVFIFARNMINTARAEDMESIWKEDGSLVNIYGAEESGYVVKGDSDGTEIEYFVKPKDDGSPTFIYDDELIICTNTGCY